MSQVVLALRWYVVLQVVGLAALPLCLRLFRRLPDRGYGVARPLGLLLGGWIFWLLATFGWLHNTAGGVLVCLGIVAAAGLLVTPRAPGERRGPPARVVIATELLLLLAFAAGCLLRAHMPRIQTAGGEKWMEIAFLRAILRADTFPPHDPWLSGFAISYYYFGYVIVAMITRLAAVPPSIAFNLGLATLFALTCTGAYSLVYNLVAAHAARSGTSAGAAPRAAVLGGLAGPLLVAVVGNLGGLLEALHARGVGSARFWAWLDIARLDQPPPPFAEGGWVPTRFFWWWQSSRVLQDYTPLGAEQHVIDEFPAFSFILGDMHPHVLALPFVLLALTLAFNLYRGTRGARAPRILTLFGRAVPLPLEPWEWPVYALALGGLGFLNTWDFPIYLFVVAAACALALHQRADGAEGEGTASGAALGRWGLPAAFLGATLLGGGVLLYLPFWVGFQSQAGGVLLNLFNATRLVQFLVMFAPLLLLVAAFVVDRARGARVRASGVGRWTVTVALSVLLSLAVVVGLFLALVRVGALSPRGPASYVAAWARGDPIPGLEDVPDASARVAQSLRARLLNPWTALGLTALLVTIVLTLERTSTGGGDEQFAPPPSFSERSKLSGADRFALLLCATGALLTLGVEYVYLADSFGTRMNTVFKFYFQAWVLWAIAGAYALAGFVRRGRAGLVAVAGCLILAGLLYPALAIPARAAEYGGPPTLDGAAYLAQAYPQDYAAIAWLNENVAGAPVILEAPGDQFKSYVYEGRVSAHTGLPTLLGWGGHEHQWRGSYEEQARREPDIERLYNSVDPGEVLALLERYGVRYVYVGPLERQRYSPSGLAKFAGLLDVVYEADGVTIYERTP